MKWTNKLPSRQKIVKPCGIRASRSLWISQSLDENRPTMMTSWVGGRREFLARSELCTHCDRLLGLGSLVQNGGTNSADRGLKKDATTGLQQIVNGDRPSKLECLAPWQLYQPTADSTSVIMIWRTSKPNALIFCCCHEIQFCFAVKLLTDVFKLAEVRWVCQ